MPGGFAPATGTGGRAYTTTFSSETTAESCLDLGVNVREDGVEITYVATHDCNDVTTPQETESRLAVPLDGSGPTATP